MRTIVVSSKYFLKDPERYVKLGETNRVQVKRDGKIILSFSAFIQPGDSDTTQYEYSRVIINKFR